MISSSVALSSKFFISWHYRHRSNSVKISKSFSNSYICNNFAVPLIFVLYFCNRNGNAPANNMDRRNLKALEEVIFYTKGYGKNIS